uniref:EF-hand domain-containing protein n=1 Tax=Haptolina ericina TaxID=156174 RepID=A0A7S3ER79_9EUKA|mmetsp:Transcript_15532/g.34797  ORF Transcript_15532/g.34797 Transcript_15532/m.34797 type:complete len:216 (+) Transcript_15532:41-688(+)
MDEQSAAVYIQSAKRGKEARDAVSQKRQSLDAKAKAKAEKKEQEASAKLGAGVKGYTQRRRAKLEAQENSKAAVTIQARFRGKKERSDPAAEANLRRARSKNDPQIKAEAYMKEHKLMELFELLGQKLVRDKPDDPRSYLVNVLEEIRHTPDKTSPMNFFTDTDISTLHSMYDHQKNGITRAQCREALTAIGLDQVAVPDMPRIDLATFKGLVGS